jgi:hypothetical protein
MSCMYVIYLQKTLSKAGHLYVDVETEGEKCMVWLPECETALGWSMVVPASSKLEGSARGGGGCNCGGLGGRVAVAVGTNCTAKQQGAVE